MADRILLCVDVSYQSYRAAAAHPGLTCDGVFTGGLYGFLMTFGKMVRETWASDVAFCLDTKPYLRSLDYPDYKLLRKSAQDPELKDRMQTTKSQVLELLYRLGFAAWSVPGMESDDIIAHCVRKYRHRFARIYAASNDSDLVQLMDWPGFYLLKDDVAKAQHLGTLRDAFGQPLAPADFIMSTALTGTHNDIAGIDRVGPVTAMKAVRDPALMRNLRDKHATIIDRNLGLIKLPHREFPRSATIPTHKGGYDRRDLYRWLGQLDIDTTQAMADAFEQLQPRKRS